MKKISLCLLIALVLVVTGCSGNKEYAKEVAFDPKGSERDVSDYVFKNTSYFEKCTKEYNDVKLVDDGTYQCTNNGIQIQMGKYSNNFGLTDITFSIKDNGNKEALTKEVNTFLKTQKMKPMTSENWKDLENPDKSKVIINGVYFFYTKEKDDKGYYHLTVSNTKVSSN
jgi:hypothetical protein